MAPTMLNVYSIEVRVCGGPTVAPSSLSLTWGYRPGAYGMGMPTEAILFFEDRTEIAVGDVCTVDVETDYGTLRMTGAVVEVTKVAEGFFVVFACHPAPDRTNVSP